MQRTRYRIGAGGALYLTCTALVFIGARYTQNNLLFWIFGLALGGLAVSLLLARVLLRKVTMERLLPTQGVADQPLALRYRIVNRGWLPVFGLMVAEHWPGVRRRWFVGCAPAEDDPTRGSRPHLKAAPLGWVLHLGPGQTMQAEAVCRPLRRGELAFRQIVLSHAFPFGIIRKQVLVTLHDRLLIYPRLHRMNRRVLHRAAAVDAVSRLRQEKPGGQEDFFGLRHYRMGDNLKTVDWKHSAKTGKMISRDLTQTRSPQLMIALDLRDCPDLDDPEAYKTVERAISFTASIVCDCYLHNYRVGLIIWGVAGPTFAVHHSLPHRTRILEALSQLDVAKTSESQPWSTQITAQPSLVIRAGAGMDDGSRRNGRIVLGSDDIHKYITELDSDAAELLTSQHTHMPQRENISAATDWMPVTTG